MKISSIVLSFILILACILIIVLSGCAKPTPDQLYIRYGRDLVHNSYYTSDYRTGLCFLMYQHNGLSGVAEVECTSEVAKAIFMDGR